MSRHASSSTSSPFTVWSQEAPEPASLVTKHRHGRERLVRGDIDAVQQARLELRRLEQLWRGRLDRFGEVLADVTKEGSA